jgi:AcrR family transcriptional regulator
MVTVAKEILGRKELREEILQAALKLFTEKGYCNTSISDISKEVEVSPGTLYHCFKNKYSIAEALSREILENLSDSIEEIKTHTPHAFERLRTLLELFFRLAEDAPYIMRFIFWVFPTTSSMVLSKPFEQLSWIMAEGIKNGEIRRMDPNVASACFYGIVAQVVQMHLEGALEKPLDRYLLDTWTAIWRALAPT